MHHSIIQKILGLLLMIFSTTMAVPMVISLAYQDGAEKGFISAFSAIILTGFVLWWPVRNHHRDLRIRDGFLVVVAFWVSLISAGSLPFLLADATNMSVTDAFFESASGLTTTGATVITGIDYLPESLQFYRQQLQWLGGMGIIVLAVAIMPMLGVGGMQLYRAEAPGPAKDNKLTPRITETAKALWYIYLFLTVLCTVAYWLAGMTWFDALNHAFSTVSIGGFSNYDASMGHFNSPLIEMIAVFFMLLAGANFSLHFAAWQRKTTRYYILDPEFRFYIILQLSVAVFVGIYLYASHAFDNLGTAMHHGIFQTVSFGTTTGFTTANFAIWPSFVPVLLIFLSFMGGCAGSTGGGIKVIRLLLLMKQGWRELMRVIHPNAQILVKVGNRATNERIRDAVWGFFAAYIGIFAIAMLLLMASGLDQVTAFSAVAASLNNLGPGLGDVASHYGDINDFTKWVLSLTMLIGRLEIFTLVVLFTPAFWRR